MTTQEATPRHSCAYCMHAPVDQSKLEFVTIHIADDFAKQADYACKDIFACCHRAIRIAYPVANETSH